MPSVHFLDGFHFAMTIGVVLSLIALMLAASVNEKKRYRQVGEVGPLHNPES